MSQENQKLKEIAKKISTVLSQEENLDSISEETEQYFKENISDEDFNLYPSLENTACHNLAVFIQKASDSKMFFDDLEVVLQSLVQHAQGYCLGKSKEIVVLINDYSVEEFSPWLSNIAEIQKTATLEFYLDLGHGKVSKIDV